MNVGDWHNSFAILMVGVFLGLALDLLFQLDGVAFWVAGIGLPVVFGGVFLFDRIFDGLFDRLFPSGIRPARKPQTPERKPLALLLSLPIGIIIGIVGAQFGLGQVLLTVI